MEKGKHEDDQNEMPHKKREPLTIRSFQALGAALSVRSREQGEETLPSPASIFADFNKISPGRFASALEGVDSITIIPRGNFVNIKVWYQNERGKEVGVDWSITQDEIIGKAPRGLKVSRQELAQEILETIKRIDFPFWRKVNIKFLPEKDPGESREVKEKEGRLQARLDPERLKFLENIPRVLFGFVNQSAGFEEYHGVFILGKNGQPFLVIDHPRVENAAFIIDFPEAHEDFKPGVFKLPPAQRVSPEEVARLTDKYLKPIFETAKTRNALLQKGATRIVHLPGKWQQTMQFQIELR